MTFLQFFLHVCCLNLAFCLNFVFFFFFFLQFSLQTNQFRKFLTLLLFAACRGLDYLQLLAPSCFHKGLFVTSLTLQFNWFPAHCTSLCHSRAHTQRHGRTHRSPLSRQDADRTSEIKARSKAEPARTSGPAADGDIDFLQLPGR